MSGSFAFTAGGDMVINKDGRIVFTTAGRLVSLLPSASDFGSIASPQTISVAYPDLTKDWVYNWRWQSTNAGGGNYNIANRGDAYITAPPQEWSATTILAAAPAGANLVAAKVRINRTTAPANAWSGNTIAVKPKQNVWMPFTGSLLVEEQVGMCRAFSLYIDGSSNLILHRQQSVSTGPGSGVDHTTWNGGSPLSSAYYGDTAAGGSGTKRGGEWVYNAAAGLTIYNDGTMSGSTTGSVSDFPPGSGIISVPTNRRLGQANALPTTDTTNYASTYTVDLAIKFGRAS